jgi:quinol monooxygenase YgiN
MIHVIATIEVAPGKREAFLDEFRKVVPSVRAEAGCLAYGPAVDVPPLGLAVQPPPRDNVVTVVEQWESVEALQAHFQAAHMTAYRARVKDLVVSTKVHVMQPA